MGDCLRVRGAIAHHRQLPAIDAGSAVFTSLIDPDHRVNFTEGRGAAHAGDLCVNSLKMASAPSDEMRKFQPASEMPSRLHGALSQRVSGADMIASRASPPGSMVEEIGRAHV